MFVTDPKEHNLKKLSFQILPENCVIICWFAGNRVKILMTVRLGMQGEYRRVKRH